MSYIFRLHNDGINALTNWGNSTKYSTNVIEQIKDPSGESAKREITSIPSPFARIDLVKTAFGKAAKNVDEKTIHHKMVSDAFDVGQIFFEYDKLQDQFEIIVWDKQVHLNELLNSYNHEHQLLGKTYDIFLKQDGEMYNFQQMDRMYLLNFKNGPQMTNIIGATSPATLFFTSANNLNYVSNVIRFGNNDRPFDDNYTPLYKRDLEYQKFWYAFQKTPNFPRLFPEVNKYLEENFKYLDGQKQQILREITVNDLQAFQDVIVNSDSGNVVYIINNLPMKQKMLDTDKIAKQSGFLIETSVNFNGKKPLVLPITKFTKPTFYASGQWDSNTKAPFYDATPVQNRTLPEDGTKYPYLTISDFLTDTIIRMPYEIDKNNFFDGNINKSDGFSYLLPFKDLFFTFFTAKDLTDKVMADGKKMFELQANAAGVSAILRIPVRSGYIEYRRTYFEGTNADDTKETNDGAVIDKKFGLGIMPLIKFPENVRKHYRIAMFDKGGSDKVELTCYDSQTNKINKEAHIERTPKDLADNLCSIESYVINENFDRILVEIGSYKSFIIPKFKPTSGNTEFTFAIDFGTTNTHIEYCNNKTQTEPISFDVLFNEKQLQRLHIDYYDNLAEVDDIDIKQAFENNFIPDTISDTSQKDNVHFHTFPMRSVLSEHKKMDYNSLLYSLADGNIPFLYEKDAFPEYNDAKTNLKWDPKIEKLISLYLGNIFILIRNKVLINGGNLSKTKIIWFYPASMSPGKIKKLNETWTELYKDFFGDNIDQVICMSESSAPYHWFYNREGGKSRLVTIDIGGGTTDAYVVESEEPKMLMSFRFASNAIFGDCYNSNSDKNGFVKRYCGKFMDILKSLKFDNLTTTFSQIERGKNSSDIIAFLFSLATNKQVKGNKSLNFLEELSKDDQLRYVFILFYGSIIYLIAQAMKKKGLKKPLTLAFSGNGAKTLRVLDDEKMKIVAKFAKLIFDGVYEDNSGTIEIIMRNNPKEATCKGGIISAKSQDYESIKKVKYSPVGDDFETIEEDSAVQYSEISDEIKNKIIEQICNFVEFIFKLHKNNDDFLTQYLNADENVLQKIKELCLDKDDLKEFLERGIKEKQAEMESDRKIEETLFFYPLIGVLNKLAREISEM